jgi:hypothetical protein
MNYKRMIWPSSYDNEDLIQEVWLEYLQQNPMLFSTKEELYEKARHDAGLIVTMYKRKQQNEYRDTKRYVILEDTYTIEEDIDDRIDLEEKLKTLDKRQLDSVQYFMGLYNLNRPLNSQERMKLKRLRQSTGLPLVIDRKKLKG